MDSRRVEFSWFNCFPKVITLNAVALSSSMELAGNTIIWTIVDSHKGRKLTFVSSLLSESMSDCLGKETRRFVTTFFYNCRINLLFIVWEFQTCMQCILIKIHPLGTFLSDPPISLHHILFTVSCSILFLNAQSNWCCQYVHKCRTHRCLLTLCFIPKTILLCSFPQISPTSITS